MTMKETRPVIRQHVPARAALQALTVAFAFVALVALAPFARAMEIQRVVSPGGIEAWLVEEHSIPLIAVNFAFSGGSAQDPEGKAGVANMVSGLLDEGAGDLDSKAFQERLQDTSVQLSFSEGRDAFYGSLRTLTTNLSEGADLLKLAVNEPRFDAEPVERIRAQVLSSIRRNEKDPDNIASRVWFKTAFPKHPYGNPSKGTEDTVKKITVDDLKAFRKDVFARENLKIAVVGAIDAETVGKLVDEVFGDLPEKANLTEVPDVSPVTGARNVESMAIPQTVIRFGGAGLKRADKDFVPAYVMNHILGGGSFTSRLYEEVREKRGLAYSVYTYLAPMDHAGIFLGGTATRSGRADETLKLIRAEIRRMAEEGPTAEELEKAKKYLIGSYPLRFDASSKIAEALVAIQQEDLGIDYIDKRNDLIEAVTLEDVKRAAKRVLAGGDLTISVVGQSSS
ncbi:peptidase M16 [Rhodobium orientis]|uniref:Peptidase M16 n=1 Tax=Rhodobium orientis TaxID=34017 RepID=A0A327JRP2_9HYPH|nr:peptidase M16 [Rhodobium orientis]RAI28083.1 peptidase M16 [Rhodobium orientis]